MLRALVARGLLRESMDDVDAASRDCWRAAQIAAAAEDLRLDVWSLLAAAWWQLFRWAPEQRDEVVDLFRTLLAKESEDLAVRVTLGFLNLARNQGNAAVWCLAWDTSRQSLDATLTELLAPLAAVRAVLGGRPDVLEGLPFEERGFALEFLAPLSGRVPDALPYRQQDWFREEPVGFCEERA